MNNLINKLTFEIDCPDEELALGLQRNFMHGLQEGIKVGIDTICSKHTEDTEAIRINKLELDLGLFNSYTIDRQLVDQFLEQFESALLDELAHIPSDKRAVSQRFSELDALIYFLNSGEKPWWVSEKLIDFNKHFLRFLQEENRVLLRLLTKQANNNYLWQRISMQFDSNVHRDLLNKVANLKQASDFVIRYVKELLEVFQIQSKLPEEQIMQLVIANRTNFIHESDISKKALFVFKENIPRLLNKFGSTESAIIARIAEALTKGESKEVKDPLPRLKLDNLTDTDEVEKRYSKYGGVVLLAYFLKPLFENLGLFEKGNWKEHQSQSKAVHLVHYLCTGEVTAQEYELTLAKLLCGQPINAPIPLDAQLSDIEINEANLVLESVLEHWQPLSNTSVDGLRNTFFLRECIISKHEGHWQITLERQTVDVLLEKLPWGFGVIAFPWNDYHIYVEW